jgi:hypothetical protein
VAEGFIAGVEKDLAVTAVVNAVSAGCVAVGLSQTIGATAIRLSLGERESGTARLEEAVKAYRATLEENTHEGVPLQWAMTQMNLGNALLRLGERESGARNPD